MIYKKAIICKTKNLFNYKTPEYVNATLIQSFPNGVILKGYASSSPGDQQYANGWFRPGDVNNANKRINLKAGEVVTISADYTLIEQYSSSSNKCNIYLYCSVTDFNNVVISQANLPLGQTVRISQTYTVKGDSDYYPVFTINSNTVMITNIQIEKGSTATNYVPYGYLQSYKRAIKVSDVCQLVPISDKADGVVNGVTFTNNHNGTWTLSGTSTAATSYYNLFRNIPLRQGHIYLRDCSLGDAPKVYVEIKWINKDGAVQWGKNPYTADENSKCDIGLLKYKENTDTVVLGPQLFDLTEMYGAGNEPKTVAEFKSRWYKNLFDISKVTNSSSIQSDDKDIICSTYGASIGVLKNLCPSLKVGDTVTLSLTVKSTTGIPPTFVQIQGQILYVSTGRATFTVTEAGLNSRFYLYNTTYENMTVPTTTVFTDIMIELGNTATSYVPYTPNPAPYRPYCFVDSRKNTAKVSDICQLLDKSKFPATYVNKGVTYTNNGDGTVTVNGTSTDTYYSNYQIPIDVKRYIPGHKYTLLSTGIQTDVGTINCTSQVIIADFLAGKYYFRGPNSIAEFPEYEGTVRSFRWEIRVNKGITVTNLVCKPQLFDLTEMYGAGNEPTMVEEFKSRWYKNLFSTSTEVGTLSGGVGPNVTRNFEEGKWYIGFATDNYYIPSNVSDYKIEENLVYLKKNINTTGYGLARSFKCEPNTDYTISFSFTSTANVGPYLGYYDEAGNYLSNFNPTGSSRHITTPANCKWLVISLNVIGIGEAYFSNLQLEKGSTATDYVPYTPNPAPYKPYCFI